MLVGMFYSNLNYVDGVLAFEFKKQRIQLSLKEFVGVYNLPCTKSNYNDDENGKEFYFLYASTSFLSNLNSRIHTPFTVGIVHLDILMIHYV